MSSEAKYTVAVEKNLPMRARDGAVLHADVHRPQAPGRFPVLVIRTPYDKNSDNALTEKAYFPPRGYVVVVQDTRGRFASEGEFYPFLREAEDGYDAIEWAAQLPWSDGRVGMVGQSYMAVVQYGMAATRPPHLMALCPVSGSTSYFENSIWRRGVFELAYRLKYFIMMARETLMRQGRFEERWPAIARYLTDPADIRSPLTRDAIDHLPLRDWGERLRECAPFCAEMLANSRYGPYWQAADLARHAHGVTVPILHVGSWYDMFAYDTVKMFTVLRKSAASEPAREGQRLLMGPWAHLVPYSAPTSRGTGQIDFGPAALIDLHAVQLRWFDYHLKEIRNGVDEEAPVRIFVMGDNVWRDEKQWPPDRVRFTLVYLSSSGKANTLRGDGRLLKTAPQDETADKYVYDPLNPAPTCGGNFIGPGNGVRNQVAVEERDDVLVYSGEVLDSDLEVTGPVVLKLFASSSAPDTDFTAKLVDVRPDGFAQNLLEGIVRARFRDSLESPTLIKPGEVYEYSVDLWSTSHVFKAGHRLRLEISSSNFPRYDRNQNTGADLVSGVETRPASQTVFHDRRYPSRLILPVIPR
ncbi:MAG TPA: CocE/NonD family hydrolase [Candidatus Binataceae bacterium]|nr:CocE/NonD family hydrolase [Candidatus Binataceae bacterium]